MKPSAPAFATAATSGARPTHCIPPCTSGYRIPNSSVNLVLTTLPALLTSLWGLEELQDGGVGLAAALAHGLQPVADAVVAHVVHQRRHDPGTRTTQRVAQ